MYRIFSRFTYYSAVWEKNCFANNNFWTDNLTTKFNLLSKVIIYFQLTNRRISLK